MAEDSVSPMERPYSMQEQVSVGKIRTGMKSQFLRGELRTPPAFTPLSGSIVIYSPIVYKKSFLPLVPLQLVDILLVNLLPIYS